jgi:hypothetical protein
VSILYILMVEHAERRDAFISLNVSIYRLVVCRHVWQTIDRDLERTA